MKLMLSALFAALIFVGTQFIRVPLPFGYFNLGDCFVILTAVLIPSPYSIISAAVGSALSDILSGYTIYAPATAIIKPLMVILAGVILKTSVRKGTGLKFLLLVSSAVCSECVMIGGYFLYDTFLYGVAGASASVFGNIMQGFAGTIASVLLVSYFERSGFLKYINNRYLN